MLINIVSVDKQKISVYLNSALVFEVTSSKGDGTSENKGLKDDIPPAVGKALGFNTGSFTSLLNTQTALGRRTILNCVGSGFCTQQHDLDRLES